MNVRVGPAQAQKRLVYDLKSMTRYATHLGAPVGELPGASPVVSDTSDSAIIHATSVPCRTRRRLSRPARVRWSARPFWSRGRRRRQIQHLVAVAKGVRADVRCPEAPSGMTRGARQGPRAGRRQGGRSPLGHEGLRRTRSRRVSRPRGRSTASWPARVRSDRARYTSARTAPAVASAFAVSCASAAPAPAASASLAGVVAPQIPKTLRARTAPLPTVADAYETRENEVITPEEAPR